MSMLSSTQQQFYAYFKAHYAHRTEEWAACLRCTTVVNTNMHIEAFHRLLKVVYLENKQNRRLDHLLFILLRLSRDKTFERIAKLHKGKNTHRISELNKRHRASSELEPEKVSDEKWMVCSQNTPNKTYSIVQELKSCKCFLRCGFCDVCVHMYTCTCMDYSLHSTACKHIHAVHRLDSNKASTSAEPVNKEISLNDIVSDDNYLCRVCRDPSITSESLLHVKQEQLHSKLSELNGMVSSCTDMDVLKTAMKHISSAVSVIKTSETTSHRTTDLVTRKRKKTMSQHLTIPSISDSKVSKTLLASTVIKVCAVCFCEDDVQDSGEPCVVEWLQCEICDTWNAPLLHWH